MLKIPKHLWNTYDSRVQVDSTQSEIRSESSRPTNCNVKISRFQHGGPQRQRKGQWQNEITYEQPCLRPTCISCWRWHPHLLRLVQDEPGSGEALNKSSLPEDADGKTSPTTERVVRQDRQRTTQDDVFKGTRQIIHLPTPLSRTPEFINPAQVNSHSTPLRRHTVRLVFVSQEGKAKFKALVKMWEGNSNGRGFVGTIGIVP